ncbi:MAG: hypothetical protein ACR2JJ_09370 [Sphingomicrobium sp.]
MRKQMIENAAYDVATQVRTVEDTIDAALSEIAELQSRIMRVNSVAGVGYGVIHPTRQKVSAAVTGLVETRGSIVACHEELADAKGKVPGLRTVSWGDGDDCPGGIAKTDLRIVA